VVNRRDGVNTDEGGYGNGNYPNTVGMSLQREEYTAMTILENGFFS
jgi:hypothetical protein